jgi:nicotinamidase-related amidase
MPNSRTPERRGRLLLDRTALLVVDPQKGFSELCPKELPVPGATGIVGALNKLLAIDFYRRDASQDWHPRDHRSFADQEARLRAARDFHPGADCIYPPHCVANTKGAAFLPRLKQDRFTAIYRKGTHRDHEAYAVTAPVPGSHPGYLAELASDKIQVVVAGGICRNICVAHALVDIAKAGFRTLLVREATVALDSKALRGTPLDPKKADARMRRAGVEFVTLDEVLSAIG